MNMQRLEKQSRQRGKRQTPIRRALLQILERSEAPESQSELLSKIQKKNRSTNKTTIYRQLEILKEQNIIQEVRLDDRARRYELVEKGDHHHHLVCENCGKIKDAKLPADLEKQEKEIWKKNHFKVLRHSLEFFGTCAGCIKK